MTHFITEKEHIGDNISPLNQIKFLNYRKKSRESQLISVV
uniref:Uncharacterized protein n=1 Tax=Lepeophtheirus salmonis TaxID=72036 RepID=A0A0K2T897_LEPSM